ncbi:hypothetical protein BU26DRAFT_506819 [Trematosphaeria pertusa]|uniref:EthD domain-containing protein n=1 Tax=Trematosphaeria pertusa TaxID=390896 RepID=A0A6A6IDM9_9PLEO|nr:uncharacterized protein BU26DRAFT_506819 [Trematosphaeria pertusa]KAF2247613.1 hypothetical protein BU26DRAFT_506819 [Trematosphaeria pertusa]
MAPGCIVVYLDAKDSSGFKSLEKWLATVRTAIPGVQVTMKLEATDTVDESERPYRLEYLLQVADIDNIQDSTIESLRASAKDLLTRSDWNLFRSISFDKKPDFDASVTPPLNMQLVQVGMAPRNDPDNIADYHNWYKTEHMPFLAQVPGWQVGNRYEFVRAVGDKAEIVRPFLAAHLYDEVNGLGGPEWRKSVDSQYTKRVQKNCVEPNHRRTWKVVG